MRPPSRESGWRRREDQGLNPACSIPKRAGRERELAEVTQGVTSEVGEQEGVWDLGGKGDQLCQNGTCLVPNKGPMIRSLFWFLLIPLLGGGREQRIKLHASKCRVKSQCLKWINQEVAEIRAQAHFEK